jgi:hypothetical protein
MTRSPNGVTSALRIASKPTIHVGGWANINRAASAAPQTNGCACHSVGVNEVGADQKFADPEFRFDGVALGHRVILQGRLSHGSSRSD